MDRFAVNFVRDADGSWRCHAQARFKTADGIPVVILPGAVYRRGSPLHGYDVAEWLDHWTETGVRPYGIEFPDQRFPADLQIQRRS